MSNKIFNYLSRESNWLQNLVDSRLKICNIDGDRMQTMKETIKKLMARLLFYRNEWHKTHPTTSINYNNSMNYFNNIKTIPLSNSDKNKKCVILVPYLNAIESKTDESLRILESRGYEVWRVYGFSCISQGRSKIVYDAIYRRGFEEVLWIDSDVAFNPDDVDRLRNHNLPLVGGCYPMKGYPIMTFAPLNNEEVVFDGRLIEVKALATGFLFIKAEVFHKMKEKLNLPVCNTSFSTETIPFFKPEIWKDGDNSYFLGEDFSFTMHCKEIGYSPILDTGIRLSHIGKYSYSIEDVINETGKKPKPNTGKTLIYKDNNINSSTISSIYNQTSIKNNN